MKKPLAYGMSASFRNLNQKPLFTHRVGLVSLGQTPRGDLSEEITHFVSTPMEPIELGLLDNVHQTVIDDLLDNKVNHQKDSVGKANYHETDLEPGLLTQLNDGRSVILSLDYASDRMQFIYDELAHMQVDLVVLMTTIICPTPPPARATVFCDKVVDRAIQTFASSGLKVGVIISLASQSKLLRFHNGNNNDLGYSIKIAAAQPDDLIGMKDALSTLNTCDVIVLHSISYNEEYRKYLAKTLGKPVIHARRLIASAIQEALERLGSTREIDNKTDSDAVISKLRMLSPREREIMFKVSSGMTNKEIAFQLGISFRTVEIHRSRMMSKMGFRSIADLVRMVDGLLEF
jgi:protein AroM